MEERISRTAGNVYEKADKDTWKVFPKKKKFTSFVDVMELIISDEDEGIDFENLEDVNVEELINEIQTMEL